MAMGIGSKWSGFLTKGAEEMREAEAGRDLALARDVVAMQGASFPHAKLSIVWRS
jgi:hypothetical protein